MVKQLCVTAAAVTAMSMPRPRTLRRWGFNLYGGIGCGDTSAGCHSLDGFQAWRPLLTDRRGRGHKRR
jgi:hypothetical protein